MPRIMNDIIDNLPENERQIVDKLTSEMLVEADLYTIRQSIKISQKEIASRLGISQPSVVALEKRGNDIKLGSLKRYIEALGGELSVNIKLPTGLRINLIL